MHPDCEYSNLSGVRGCILNQFRRLVVYGKDRIKRWKNKKLARTNLSSHQLQTEVFIHVTAALKRGRGVGKMIRNGCFYKQPEGNNRNDEFVFEQAIEMGFLFLYLQIFSNALTEFRARFTS